MNKAKIILNILAGGAVALTAGVFALAYQSKTAPLARAATAKSYTFDHTNVDYRSISETASFSFNIDTNGYSDDVAARVDMKGSVYDFEIGGDNYLFETRAREFGIYLALNNIKSFAVTFGFTGVGTESTLIAKNYVKSKNDDETYTSTTDISYSSVTTTTTYVKTWTFDEKEGQNFYDGYFCLALYEADQTTPASDLSEGSSIYIESIAVSWYC